MGWKAPEIWEVTFQTRQAKASVDSLHFRFGLAVPKVNLVYPVAVKRVRIPQGRQEMLVPVTV
jgi:hypothetical protein